MEGLCPGCQMREVLRQFWEINYVPLYAAYGQAWFVLAMVALLNNRRRSQLPLARSIWLLGLYGITHALREWGFVFIPVQATYLPDNVVSLMEWVHMVLLPVSFLFLLAFTVHLGVLLEVGPRQLWVFPGLLMAGWTGFVLLMYGGWQWSTAQIFRYADIAARYAMALPAGISLSVFLWYQASVLPPWVSQQDVRWLRCFSLTFLAFALFDGLITPRAAFFPANLLNYSLLLQATGFPIPAYRILVALTLALSTWATVRLFEEDVQQRIRVLEQERVLLEDRERISRELHDHTIQALYALGLEVERAATLIHRDPREARDLLGEVMARLNDIIFQTRTFVYNLRNGEPMTFPQLVDRALSAVHARERLEVRVFVDESLTTTSCADERAQHIVAILQEALSNTIKHARARSAKITVSDEGDSIIICVCDDGRGFDPKQAHRGMGLYHMEERARLLGGVLNVQSRVGEGTKVRLIVPRVGEAGEAAYVARGEESIASAPR